MKKYKIGLALLCRFKGCWLFLLTGDGGVFLSDIGEELHLQTSEVLLISKYAIVLKCK